MRFICQVEERKRRQIAVSTECWRIEFSCSLLPFFLVRRTKQDKRFHAIHSPLPENQTLCDSSLSIAMGKKQRTAQKEEASYYHPARPRQAHLFVCPGADKCNRGKNTFRFLYAETHVVSRGIIDRLRRQQQAQAPQQGRRQAQRAWQPRPPPS